MRVRFISVGFPGVSEWLRHGAAEGLWDATFLGGERVEVPPADAFGVGAWSEAYGAVHDAVRERGASFGVAWASSPQESDASRTQVELAYLMGLTSERSPYRPDWWMCLSPGLAEALPGAFHVAAPVHVEGVPIVAKEDAVAFFSPGTEKKAVFSQLLAVKMFQKEHPSFVLRTNLANYEPLLRWLGIRFEMRPWMPRDELLLELARCRVAMHASLAEGFGYGAVDALAAGTPVVGSPAMPWIHPEWRAMDANDPFSVKNAMERAIGSDITPRLLLESVAREQNARARAGMAALEGFIEGRA